MVSNLLIAQCKISLDTERTEVTGEFIANASLSILMIPRILGRNRIYDFGGIVNYLFDEHVLEDCS